MAVTQQEIENRLWDAADELRVAMPEAQYSSVVFPLMFWKYLSDTWDHHQEFLAENEGLDGLSAEEAHEIEYRDYRSFEIPFIYPGTVQARRASWSSILATTTQPGLGQRARASLQAIETANPDKFSRLFGSMTWTSEEVLSGEVLAAVMQAMDRTPKMHEGNMSHDVLGGAYEYLLKRFSDGSGTRAGQFFTPREVVELIVELLDPKNFESVYDPTCGSGGMLIASANLLKARGGRGYTLKLHGQGTASTPECGRASASGYLLPVRAGSQGAVALQALLHRRAAADFHRPGHRHVWKLDQVAAPERHHVRHLPVRGGPRIAWWKWEHTDFDPTWRPNSLPTPGQPAVLPAPSAFPGPAQQLPAGHNTCV